MRSLRISLVAATALSALAALTLSVYPQGVAAHGASGTPQQGAAPVTIVNPLPVPVSDVHSLARTPVQFNFAPDYEPYAVPSGKRLVIEFVSGLCYTDAPGRVSAVQITTSLGSQTVGHAFVPVISTSSATTTFQVFSQSTNLYAAAGTEVFATISGVQASPTCPAVSFSGYLTNQ